MSERSEFQLEHYENGESQNYHDAIIELIEGYKNKKKNNLNNIKEKFKLSDDIIDSNGFQEIARNTALDFFLEKKVFESKIIAHDLLNRLNESTSDICLTGPFDPVLSRLSKGQLGFADIIYILDRIKLPKNYKLHEGKIENFREMLQKAIYYDIKKRNYISPDIFVLDPIIPSSFENEFHKLVQSDLIKSLVKDEYISCIQNGDLKYASYLEKDFALSKDFINSPEVESVAANTAKDMLQSGQFNEFKKLIYKFNINTKEIKITHYKFDPIKLIPYLGDKELFYLVPKLKDIKESIFTSLSLNVNIADYFLENIDNYPNETWTEECMQNAVKHKSVLNKFLIRYEADNKFSSYPWVKNLVQKYQEELDEINKQVFMIDEDYYSNDDGDDSVEYQSSKNGTEGFVEDDPHKNDMNVFGADQIYISRDFSKLLDNPDIDLINMDKLNIDESISPEIRKSFKQIGDKIKLEYDKFVEQIGTNSGISNDDKENVLGLEYSDIKLTELLKNVKSFVARYITQKIKGNIGNISQIDSIVDGIGPLLHEGFKRFIQIYKIDIPLYDKLYEEFDDLRENGRYPMEVYLGRDGIYAWIGRRAQDVARRRKMGLEGRNEQNKKGTVLEIHPKYLVYPRYFRDNLTNEVKKQFLEQERISLDADPLFYDTGYTGTIPEQIMKIMDFDQHEIEKRIRLLSAPIKSRRVRGIEENARYEIIEYIESNAKLEESAEGLIVDKNTGKIKHIAKPTSPEEQFYFMMIKQAIARHYWIKEYLNRESFDKSHENKSTQS